MTHLFLVSMIDSISGVDTLWVLLGAMLVFWMQPGFALVEAGMTRSKLYVWKCAVLDYRLLADVWY